MKGKTQAGEYCAGDVVAFRPGVGVPREEQCFHRFMLSVHCLVPCVSISPHECLGAEIFVRERYHAEEWKSASGAATDS